MEEEKQAAPESKIVPGGQQTGEPAPATPVKRDWDQLVADNPTTMFNVPAELKAMAKGWQESRLNFKKEANKIAKTENEIGLVFNGLIHKLREHLEAAGIEDVWTMDIGFNTEALKDGKFVINIAAQGQGGQPQ